MLWSGHVVDTGSVYKPLICLLLTALLLFTYGELFKTRHHLNWSAFEQGLSRGSSSSRTLKQSVLSALVPADDPFVSAESVGNTGLFQHTLWSAASHVWRPFLGEYSAPSYARTTASRGNATHTYRFSHTMQIEIPQPWDAINMSQILKDNLEHDLLFWQQLEYIPSVQDLFHQAQNHPQLRTQTNTRRLVEIRNNVVRFPLMPEGPLQYHCDEWCDPQLADWLAAMHDAVHVFNLTLPDVLFIINTDDGPICNQEQVMKRECTVPIISLAKEVHMADLIGPVMKKSDSTVVYRYLPWSEKKDMAFFRGVPSCGDMSFPPLCARSLVARLAQVNYSHVLDAGLVEAYNRSDQIKGDPVLRDGNGSLPVLPRVPMSELPKYKWLLNLDGHIAAYRLAQLLATNSLVLKQQSDMVEYYYRSLRVYHHYVPIFKNSEHDLMPRIEWAMTHEDVVRHIVINANYFALKYTTYKARVYYWKYVLLAYKKLFDDQDAYFGATAELDSTLQDLLQQQLVDGPQQQLQ